LTHTLFLPATFRQGSFFFFFVVETNMALGQLCLPAPTKVLRVPIIFFYQLRVDMAPTAILWNPVARTVFRQTCRRKSGTGQEIVATRAHFLQRNRLLPLALQCRVMSLQTRRRSSPKLTIIKTSPVSVYFELRDLGNSGRSAKSTES